MFITKLPADHVAISGLIGETIETSEGETIGEINDILISKAGHVAAILIGPGGLLGVGGKLVGVPFGALTIVDTGHDRQIRLEGVSKDEMLVAPEYQLVGPNTLTRLKEQAATAGQAAAGKAAKMSQIAAERTAEFGQVAVEKASVLGHEATGKATVLAHAVAERTSLLGHNVAQKASELGHKASKAATELGHRAMDQVTNLTQKVVARDDREQASSDQKRTDDPIR